LLIGFLGEKPRFEAPSSAQPAGQDKGLSEAKRILQDVDLDEEATASVYRVLKTYRSGEELDTMEFRIVRDACTRAKLPDGSIHGEQRT
jgi:hypothetical protein